ncbi:MAG: hypothetical protein IJV00_04135 [Clostridia bacterium]|nr:hypothetical protein [Clostridia bacterium]
MRLYGNYTSISRLCQSDFSPGPALAVFDLEVCGTEGSYHARFGGGDLAELRLSGAKSRVLTKDEIPLTLPSPILAWTRACTDGGDCSLFGIDAALGLVRLMEAAYRSAENGGVMTPVGRDGI